MAEKANTEATAVVTDSRQTSRTVGSEPASGAPVGNDADEHKITVRALRHFHKEAGGKGDMLKPGDEFECTRDRAMQLRANGLIEYPDAEQENKLHGESAARALGARHAADAESRKLPENAKTTPLRNPELKMADVKTGKDAQK